MARKIIELEGSDLLIETELIPNEREFRLRAGKPQKNPIEQIEELLEQVAQPIAKAHEKLSANLAKLDLNQIEIKLAAGFKGEGRLCIVSGTAEASVQITIICRRKE